MCNQVVAHDLARNSGYRKWERGLHSELWMPAGNVGTVMEALEVVSDQHHSQGTRFHLLLNFSSYRFFQAAVLGSNATLLNCKQRRCKVIIFGRGL